MEAFRRGVSNGMELTARAEAYIRESPVLELMNPASLGIVCFRVNPEGAGLDEQALEIINRNVLVRVFWEDRAFMSSTLLHGKFSLRLCIINHNTAWDEVRGNAGGQRAIRERGSAARVTTIAPHRTKRPPAGHS